MKGYEPRRDVPALICPKCGMSTIHVRKGSNPLRYRCFPCEKEIIAPAEMAAKGEGVWVAES